MQWQHGTYSLPGNGSLILTPIAVDGRQLTSSPCSYSSSVYIRYEQQELIKSYQALTDEFHNVPRLNLFRFDGSPQQPLYLVATSPEMLPTQTLNPTTSAPAATGKSKMKRDFTEDATQRVESLLKGAIPMPSDPFNADRWWWVGVGLTALGTAMYMMPTSV